MDKQKARNACICTHTHTHHAFLKINKFAFSLAEILVALVIVGIVAAMTLPPLLNNMEKQGFAEALETNYSLLNQAFSRYSAEQGCVGDLGCTKLFSSRITDPSILQEWSYFVNNYLKISMDCKGNTSGANKCFTQSIKLLNYPSSTPWNPSNDWNAYNIVLLNGASVNFNPNNASCTNADIPPQPYGATVCGTVGIDVNGNKGPNIAGRDYFTFMILKNKGLSPYYSSAYAPEDWNTGNKGGGNSLDNCNLQNTSRGNGCAARIMEEGWKMNY